MLSLLSQVKWLLHQLFHWLHFRDYIAALIVFKEISEYVVRLLLLLLGLLKLPLNIVGLLHLLQQDDD